MVMKQAFNKRTGAYVKFKEMADGKTKFVDVKQKQPKKPFKGIKRC